MKIYAIGDLHLSGKPPSKPMEIFGKHWTDHAAKVAANWHQLIRRAARAQNHSARQP